MFSRAKPDAAPPLKVLVLAGHPSSQSFSTALARAYAGAARQAGAELRFHDLGAMRFDPSLPVGHTKTPPLEPDLAAFWDDLVWADHFALFHPLWWGAMPAQLKGLFDRVLLPGKAYKYQKGSPLPKKLLTGRSARLVLNSDTPDWYFRLAYGAAYFRQARGQILAFCGFSPVRFTHIGPIISMPPAKRQAALERMARLGSRDAAQRKPSRGETHQPEYITA